MKTKAKVLFDLYFTFMKIGGFTLGGGYAMIPIIQHEVVDVKKWATDEEMTDFMTLGQSAPGIIGINTATAVGYKVAGFYGGLFATLGMITPSVIIILIISSIFEQFKKWDIIQRAFNGIRATVVALIFIAAIRLCKTSIKNKIQFIIAASTVICMLFFKIPPQFIILGSALFGVIYNYFNVSSMQ